MLVRARQIPFEGEPPDVHAILEANRRWLADTSVPVLLVAAEPGAILVGPVREWLQALPSVTTIELSAGHRFPRTHPSSSQQPWSTG